MKRSLFIIFSLAVLLISSTTLGSEGGIYKFKADCTMEIVGEPKIHEPFEAIFTFTPRQEIVHPRGIPDTAKFNMSEDIKFVKGDTLWTGLLENGKTYTLSAWFVVNDPVYFRVQCIVRTKGATGIVGHMKGTPDPGANAYNGKGSQLFDFREEESRELKKHYLTNDSTILFTPYYINDSMLKLIGPAPVIAISPSDAKIDKERERPILTKNANYIYLDSAKLLNIKAIEVSKRKPNILKFDSSVTEIKFPKRKNSFYIVKLRGNEYRIWPSENDTLINIQYKDSLYQLIINFVSSDFK